MKSAAALALAFLLGAAGGARTRAGEPPGPDAAPGAPPLALTPTEYNNTVADLLSFPRDGERWPPRPALADALSPRRAASTGVFLPPPPPPVWPWRFPAEPGAGGFEGIAQGQNPSSRQVEELHLAAMHFASFAPGSAAFSPCREGRARPRAGRERCARAAVERFAERAWRRPLDAGERERLLAFWRANLARAGTDEAVALTVAGILQAPAFHFRIERGGPGGPTPWETAARLSYFLWDSMPDDALSAAAAAGALSSRGQVERQARRMLADPKARPAVVHFHNQWLGTDDVLRIAPARRAFGPRFGLPPEIETARDDDVQWPAVLGPLRHSLKLETELFVERTVFDGDGTFTALLTDHHGYLSDATAPIHGPEAARLAGRPAVTRRIEFVAASIGRKETLTLHPAAFPPERRAGVLTHPSFLAAGAYAVQPGPIPRGVHVLERVACVEPGTPIQGAETALPPDSLAVESTNRERTAAATSAPACASCHRRINPAGFAFEHYDALGAWRARDNGRPVDASGSLTLPGGETLAFTDGVDFVRQLAASGRARDCYALHWTRTALGRRIEAAAPGLAPIQRRFREDDSIRELLVAIAGSDLFRGAPPAGGVPGDAR